MRATLERLDALHEALMRALDANDVGAIEAASAELEKNVARLKQFVGIEADPDLKRAAERIAERAEAATMRINVLSDLAKQRSQSLAAARGQAMPALYSR